MSTLFNVPYAAKISCTCSLVTLRVRRPMCSRVILTGDRDRDRDRRGERDLSRGERLVSSPCAFESGRFCLSECALELRDRELRERLELLERLLDELPLDERDRELLTTTFSAN